MELKKLKSGTDIRGTAIVESGNPQLSEKEARLFARAFVRVFGLRLAAIGHDGRLSANTLSEALTEGLMDEGCSVLNFGLCSTPSMFMSTVLSGTDGALMLTASHHPKDKNGIKFFTKSGGVSSAQLDEIIAKAQQIFDEDCGENCTASGAKNENGKKDRTIATYQEGDFLQDYCAHLRQIFTKELGDMPLKGLKIAVDAGNGAAGFYAERILRPLGTDISGSQFLESDGNFPNHSPNPENKQAMESISKRVVETESDLGIIFDTDGDRCAIVTADGKEINRNRLIALISEIILREEVGAHIVTDSVTSEGLKEFIADKGGVHIRYKRGYQNVISYAKQLCAQGKNAPLAIETSGHGALRENYFLDDGAYLAVKLIIEAVKLKRQGKTLGDLLTDLRETAEEAVIRIPLTGQDWKSDAQDILSVLEGLKSKYKLADDSFEGIRIYTPDGWFMARLSVHDPIIPINIESDNKGGAKRIAAIILDALKDIKVADLSLLQEFVKA